MWVVVGSSVWVMVGSGVWVVVEVGWVRYLGLVLWLKWVWCLGHGWIGRLGLVDGGFETVDLLIGGWIGWVDHR